MRNKYIFFKSLLNLYYELPVNSDNSARLSTSIDSSPPPARWHLSSGGRIRWSCEEGMCLSTFFVLPGRSPGHACLSAPRRCLGVSPTSDWRRIPATISTLPARCGHCPGLEARSWRGLLEHSLFPLVPLRN